MIRSAPPRMTIGELFTDGDIVGYAVLTPDGQNDYAVIQTDKIGSGRYVAFFTDDVRTWSVRFDYHTRRHAVAAAERRLREGGGDIRGRLRRLRRFVRLATGDWPERC